MEVIFPAYSIRASQAAKYESQIAALIHKHREDEINLFREEKLPPKIGREVPLVGSAKLPDGEKKVVGSAKGRANNSTDELVLKILRDRQLAASEIADMLRMTTQAMRHVLERLIGRGEVRKSNNGYVNLFTAVGGNDG
jgi:hypothetical protein